MKARLQEAGIQFGRTHDLTKLLTLALAIEPSWSVFRPDLLVLTDFAVEYRYPGNAAIKSEAQDAVKRRRRVRAAFRQALGLVT
jgi:hypothetical protein